MDYHALTVDAALFGSDRVLVDSHDQVMITWSWNAP